MSLLAISATVLIISWDTQYRYPAMLALVLFYCIGTAIACYRFCSLAALGKLAFADTISEIGADLALIRRQLGE